MLELRSLIYDVDKINYKKLTNKKIKVMVVNDKWILKISGKIKLEIFYFFCMIDLESSSIQLINQYSNKFK